MWSFGCILAELYTGYPLFPGENEVEQLACIMEMQGVPPMKILDGAPRIKMFFDPNGNPRLVPNSRGKTRRPGSKDIQAVLRTSEGKFVDFLQGCLQWDAKERFTPDDALQQEWILECYAKHARDGAGAAGQGGPSGASSSRMPEAAPSTATGSRTRGSVNHADSHRTRRVQGSNVMASTSTGFGAAASHAGNFSFPPIDPSSAGLPQTKSHKTRVGKGGAQFGEQGGQGSTSHGQGGLAGLGLGSGLGSLGGSQANHQGPDAGFDF